MQWLCVLMLFLPVPVVELVAPARLSHTEDPQAVAPDATNHYPWGR